MHDPAPGRDRTGRSWTSVDEIVVSETEDGTVEDWLRPAGGGPDRYAAVRWALVLAGVLAGLLAAAAVWWTWWGPLTRPPAPVQVIAGLQAKQFATRIAPRNVGVAAACDPKSRNGTMPR
jgi:hypothetical protein